VRVRIVVTGGAGYIGSVLVPMLLNDGHEVTVVDNFMYGQTSLLDCCHHRSLTVVNADVRSVEPIKTLVSKADAVLPLACFTGAPICKRDPWAAQDVNYTAVKTIADMLSPSQKMIFPSTNSGYGVGEAGIHCDEDTPLRPVSNYGVWKVELEKLLLDRGSFVTFRFATLFGMSPRMRLDLLVNDFTYRAVVDRSVVLFEPHFKRNYLHVRDAARAFVHALANYDQMKGRPFNVGLSDANISKMELCELIKTKIPSFQIVTAEVGEDPDKRNYIVSNARIEATGFSTAFGLEKGIEELIKGYTIVRRNQYANA
jgi:nucleoside-diphosphate-sugar epimerase